MRAGQELFLVQAGDRLALLPFTWRTAYAYAGRMKTSLALTRARSRNLLLNYAFLLGEG